MKSKKLPETDAEWAAEAQRLGVESGPILKQQFELAQSVLDEILAEEKKA